MAIDKTNMKAIHDVLITDMQRRLFNDYKVMRKNNPQVTDEDYDNALSIMVDSILHCNSINDINELILEYCDIFTSFDDYGILATIDGTLNYIISLLIDQCGTTIPANLVPNEYNAYSL